MPTSSSGSKNEPVGKEHIDARSAEAPLADFLAPVAPLEPRPMEFMCLLGGQRTAGRLDLAEEIVLDEVGGQEGRAPCVHRLEDGLGVVAGFERNDHEPQQFPERPSEGSELGDRIVAVRGVDHPLLDHVSEELIGLEDVCAVVLRNRHYGGAVVLDGSLEGSPIGIGQETSWDCF